MKRRFLAGLVAFSVLGGVGWHQANADALINNYGLEPGDIIYTVTFSEFQNPGDPNALNPGDTVTNQFVDYGVSFAPGDPGMKFNAQYPELPDGAAVSGDHLGNYFPVQNPFSIIFHTVFATAQTKAAFGLWTSPDTTTTFTALLEGEIVDTFNATTTFDDDASGFYGFVNVAFDEVQIFIQSPPDGSGENPNFALLDNIQLAAPSDPIPAPVPEPTTLLLFGVAAAWGVRQRRRAGVLAN
jgi:hypothetical protein